MQALNLISFMVNYIGLLIKQNKRIQAKVHLTKSFGLSANEEGLGIKTGFCVCRWNGCGEAFYLEENLSQWCFVALFTEELF